MQVNADLLWKHMTLILSATIKATKLFCCCLTPACTSGVRQSVSLCASHHYFIVHLTFRSCLSYIHLFNAAAYCTFLFGFIVVAGDT